jgi:hypothetical protein
MVTVKLVAKFFPLAFILFLFPPRVEVDGGAPQKIKWGENPLQLTPGQHHLTVYFPYLFIVPKAGKAETDITVAEGQTPTVTYKAPLIVFMKGKISVA